jgi:hypothetical protein
LYSPSKLDPESPAYEKYRRSKKFDPSRSSVLTVLQESISKRESLTRIACRLKETVSRE